MKNNIIILLLFIGTIVYSQSPDWSVNVASYQYTMTFTTFLSHNGVRLTSPNDKVGAFVNGENRGEAKVEYNSNENRYVAYLTVYANKANETINFKMYNSAQDVVVEAPQSYIFKIDENVGRVFQAFSIAQPALASSAIIDTFTLKGINEISNEIVGNKITIKVGNSVNLDQLVPVFTVSNHERLFINRVLQTSATSTVDFTHPVIYQVLSQDESKLVDYTVEVFKANSIKPVSVNLAGSGIKVNQSPITIQLEASEVVNGLEPSDFTLVNAVINDITTNDNKNFSLEIVPINQGTFTVQLPANTIKGVHNQGNSVSNTLSMGLDSKQPYLLHIRRKNPTTEKTNVNEVTFEVVFSEHVINVSANDFVSVNNSRISVSKISDEVYELKVRNLANYTGEVYLNFSSVQNIEDAFGNQLLISNYSSYEK